MAIQPGPISAGKVLFSEVRDSLNGLDALFIGLFNKIRRAQARLILLNKPVFDQSPHRFKGIT